MKYELSAKVVEFSLVNNKSIIKQCVILYLEYIVIIYSNLMRQFYQRTYEWTSVLNFKLSH